MKTECVHPKHFAISISFLAFSISTSLLPRPAAGYEFVVVGIAEVDVPVGSAHEGDVDGEIIGRV